MLPPNADAEASGQGPSAGRPREGLFGRAGQGVGADLRDDLTACPGGASARCSYYSCRAPRLQRWFPSYWRTGRGGRWRRCRQQARRACGPGRRRAWLIKGVRSPIPMLSDDGLTRAFAGRSRSVRSPSRRCCASSVPSVWCSSCETLPTRRCESRGHVRERGTAGQRPCSAYARAGPGEAWPRGCSSSNSGARPSRTWSLLLLLLCHP
jgi:hypothetical protein